MSISYKRGEVIIQQGAHETCAYIIDSGRVEVSCMVNEKKTVLAILGQKQIIGEMALMEDKARSATVTAVEDTLVSVIDRKQFNKLLTENPRKLFPIIKALFERLRTANKNIVIMERSDSQMKKAKRGEKGKTGLIVLEAANESSIKALGSKKVSIDKFPCKVGRTSTIGEDDVFADNDISLEDNTGKPPYNISSNHFLIDRIDENYTVIDRGSSLGTIVNGKKIEGPCILDKKVNALVVGAQNSPFVFTLEIK
jgi:CRP/FNR family transcriptional regulator, cyclic AMP receptor protein